VLIYSNLVALYRDLADVFVAADLFWYPVERHPEIVVAPDAFVVFGRPKGDRRSYLQWEEGNIAPQVVFEVRSPSNYEAEMERKFNFYEKYGVDEYYIYDPDRVKLSGWLRQGDRLVEIPSMQ